MNSQPHEAKWYSQADHHAVQCALCPRTCLIPDGKTGYCGIRKNLGGILYASSYGYPAAIQNDPIEKKPFAMFLPGTRVLSAGCFGCNLGCLFCQNSELSRGRMPENKTMQYVSPEVLADAAVRHGCRSIAMTYNEPTVWAEYAVDCFKAAHERGLSTVLVSNGYMLPDAAEELLELTDAANIDIKGFSEDFYSSMCGASFAPVKRICELYFSLPHSHLELTNLVIPGKNDSPVMIEAYLDWVEKSLSKEIPLHFSAYFPAYRYHESPPTSPALLYQIRDYAKNRGFPNIFLGNIR